MADTRGIPIRIRRGTKAQLTTYGPLEDGELGWTTDEHLVYAGDGSTNYLVGRAAYSASNPTGSGVSGQLHINTTTSGIFFSDGTAWINVGLSGNYATEEWVEQTINTTSGIITDYADRSLYMINVGPNCSFTSIQPAIDSITVGSGEYYLVRVFPGTYTEDITLKDNVDLVGVNYSSCIIDGSLSWPSTTCTSGNWSCILDLSIIKTSTVSGYSLITCENGEHDINNMWIILNMENTGGNLIELLGGRIHAYLPTYQYNQTGDTTSETIHKGLAMDGGIYEEQSGELNMVVEDAYGKIQGYDCDSPDATSYVRLLNPKIKITSTAVLFDGVAQALCSSTAGGGTILEAGCIEMEANAGGEGVAIYVNSSETGVASTSVLSNANRIEVTGFTFNYSGKCASTNDLWISHFDTISAADSFDGDPASIKAVHADDYGILHLTEHALVGDGVDHNQNLILMDIGQGSNPKLYYSKDYVGYARLMFENPEGESVFTTLGNNAIAGLAAYTTGSGAYDQESILALWADQTPGSGLRGWRVKNTSPDTSLVFSRYWATLSGEGYVNTFEMDYQGLTNLRYGVAVDRFLDEDTMASNSATALPTQQSVVSYINTVSGDIISYADMNYTSIDQLTTTSGDIISYVDAQGGATVQDVLTTSGVLHEEILTTSGSLYTEIHTYVTPAKYLPVMVSGGVYNKIQDAIDSITITDLETDFWVVEVYPGIYTEDIYLKDNVGLRGKAYDSCRVEGRVFWNSPACTSGNWSSIQNITIQGHTTTADWAIINCNEGSHDIENCQITIEASGVAANCVVISGGYINSYVTNYTYSSLGQTNNSASVHRNVRGLGGVWVSQSDQYTLSVEDSSGVVSAVTSRGPEENEYIRIIAPSIDVAVLSPTFSGSVQTFRIRGESDLNAINSGRTKVIGNGAGTAYGYYLNSAELGFTSCAIQSSSNRIIMENFETTYFAYLGENDLLNTHFDDVTAPSGVIGNVENYNMVSSQNPGQLRLTDHILIGNGVAQDQELIVVDVGRANLNPNLSYDYDYFDYSTLAWNTNLSGVAMMATSPTGPVLMGSMSLGPTAFDYEQRLSVWAHQTSGGDYERRGYRLKRNTDDTFSISRHWSSLDGGAFVDLLNINHLGGMMLKTGSRVDKILDEDNMISNDASALPTQQSVKAYVDFWASSISGGVGPSTSGTVTGPMATISGHYALWGDSFGRTLVDSGVMFQDWVTPVQLTTTSGDIITYVNARDTSISGALQTGLDNKTHASLLGLSNDDHPQYGHLAQNETISGNWTIHTKLGFSDYTNSSPSSGDRWKQSDNDFRSYSNNRTLIDGMVAIAQVRQTTGITRQDCNTSSGIAINWDAQDIIDGLYGHSNSSRLTVSGTAWYKISYSVAHESQDTVHKSVATQLRKNGTTYLEPGRAYSFSYDLVDSKASCNSSSLHRLSAGDYIEIVASGVGSAGQALTLQDGSCSLLVEFIRWST